MPSTVPHVVVAATSTMIVATTLSNDKKTNTPQQQTDQVGAVLFILFLLVLFGVPYLITYYVFGYPKYLTRKWIMGNSKSPQIVTGKQYSTNLVCLLLR